VEEKKKSAAASSLWSVMTATKEYKEGVPALTIPLNDNVSNDPRHKKGIYLTLQEVVKSGRLISRNDRHQ
jgi:hypothetical protein